MAQPSENVHITVKEMWNKISFYLKLVVATIVMIALILASIRSLLVPINAPGYDEQVKKMLNILQSLDTDHLPHFLPISAQWNQTQT